MLRIFSRLFSKIQSMQHTVKTMRQIHRRGGIATYQISRTEHGKRLLGKKVVVTGGGSGIGLAIAMQSLNEGAEVLITGRNEERLKKVISETTSDKLKFLQWDISDIPQTESKLQQAQSALGGTIDILINNAGLLEKKSFFEVTEKTWDDTYATNSKGLFFLSQAICKNWLDQKSPGKKIINISSQGGFVGATYPYRMTKWDIVGFTQGLAIKMAPHGIIVNGIAPGIIATSMQPQYMDENANVYCKDNPLGRFAFPEEIAELAVYLMSDISNFIVGQTILCDGGFSIK